MEKFAKDFEAALNMMGVVLHNVLHDKPERDADKRYILAVAYLQAETLAHPAYERVTFADLARLVYTIETQGAALDLVHRSRHKIPPLPLNGIALTLCQQEYPEFSSYVATMARIWRAPDIPKLLGPLIFRCRDITPPLSADQPAPSKTYMAIPGTYLNYRDWPSIWDQEGQVGHEEAVGSRAEIDVLAGDPEPAQNDSEADSGGEDSDGGSEADDEADADDGDSGGEDSEPVKQPKRWKGKGREIDCGATATSGPCVAALPKSGPSTSKVAPIVSLVPYLDSDDEDED